MKTQPAHEEVHGLTQEVEEHVCEEMLSTWTAEWVATSQDPRTVVTVAPSVWEDSGLKPWVDAQTSTRGGRLVGSALLCRPISDVPTLKARQASIRTLPLGQLRAMLASMARYEHELLWWHHVPDIKESTSLQWLFPQSWVLRPINYVPMVLLALHIFKAYVAPWMNMAGPLTTVFGPYVYMRRQLKLHIPLKAYLRMVTQMCKLAVQPTGHFRKDATKWITMCSYLAFFVLSCVQSFEASAAVRTLRNHLYQKVDALTQWAAAYRKAMRCVPASLWTAFGFREDAPPLAIPSGVAGIHALLTHADLRENIRQHLLRMYVLDACCAAKTAGCDATFTEGPTKMYGMGHVALGPRQVRNPLSLQKNLIITGPNAAGKTTYVKSLCSNILLAQSFGVCCAQRAAVQVVHALGSFMRVRDVLGSASLFEAEARRCSLIAKEARAYSQQKKRALYFLDEPMQSTPPLEGAATCIAFLDHVGSMPGIRMVTTTHYFAITRLPQQNRAFHNLSVEAIARPHGTFLFPYRVRSGPSFQCIAIELLKDNLGFPHEVIECAMEWKNKLCAREVRNHDS